MIFLVVFVLISGSQLWTFSQSQKMLEVHSKPTASVGFCIKSLTYVTSFTLFNYGSVPESIYDSAHCHPPRHFSRH